MQLLMRVCYRNLILEGPRWACSFSDQQEKIIRANFYNPD